MRKASAIDSFVVQLDDTMKTLTGTLHPMTRPYPAEGCEEAPLTAAEKKHAAGLMRVNYAGEVAAQALYQGQALTAKLDHVKDKMQQAAYEEKEHLAWCKLRLDELGHPVSALNPIWYLGSLMIGSIAGLAGDDWSLGFVVETEKQVVAHLEEHLGILPEEDRRSRAVVDQMKVDEAEHADMAREAGARELPDAIKQTMKRVAKLMTQTAYHL